MAERRVGNTDFINILQGYVDKLNSHNTSDLSRSEVFIVDKLYLGIVKKLIYHNRKVNIVVQLVIAI